VARRRKRTGNPARLHDDGQVESDDWKRQAESSPTSDYRRTKVLHGTLVDLEP
jgi:hypothetical protein